MKSLRAAFCSAGINIFFISRYAVPERGTLERCGGTLCKQGDLLELALGSFIYDRGGGRLATTVKGPRADNSVSESGLLTSLLFI